MQVEVDGPFLTPNARRRVEGVHFYCETRLNAIADGMLNCRDLAWPEHGFIAEHRVRWSLLQYQRGPGRYAQDGITKFDPFDEDVDKRKYLPRDRKKDQDV